MHILDAHHVSEKRVDKPNVERGEHCGILIFVVLLMKAVKVWRVQQAVEKVEASFRNDCGHEALVRDRRLGRDRERVGDGQIGVIILPLPLRAANAIKRVAGA